ncbi:hypothetical protein V8F20_005413 [Naviculisporaceae sp. PSN 640]
MTGCLCPVSGRLASEVGGSVVPNLPVTTEGVILEQSAQESQEENARSRACLSRHGYLNDQCRAGRSCTWPEVRIHDVEDIPMYEGTGNGQPLLAARLSWFFDLKGPSFVLDIVSLKVAKRPTEHRWCWRRWSPSANKPRLLVGIFQIHGCRDREILIRTPRYTFPDRSRPRLLMLEFGNSPDTP